MPGQDFFLVVQWGAVTCCCCKTSKGKEPQRRSDCIFHDSVCQSFQSQGAKVAAANEAVLVPCRKHVNLPVAGQDLTLDEL